MFNLVYICQFVSEKSLISGHDLQATIGFGTAQQVATICVTFVSTFVVGSPFR